MAKQEGGGNGAGEGAQHVTPDAQRAAPRRGGSGRARGEHVLLQRRAAFDSVAATTAARHVRRRMAMNSWPFSVSASTEKGSFACSRAKSRTASNSRGSHTWKWIE